MTNAIAIAIPAAFIDAAMCAVSKEETRYYLKGVFIDARGFIAATNEHMAFAARCNEAFKLAGVQPERLPDALHGVIVPDTALRAVAKGKDSQVTIERDANGLWWASRGALRTHFEPVDGNFPDWQRIIPAVPETLTAAHYQPQYVSALGDMAKALRNGKKGEAAFFRILQAGEGPALVTFDAVDDKPGPRTDCCAVLMPMRCKADMAKPNDFADFRGL